MKLRPMDCVGPSSYYSWVFDVDHIWDEISDDAFRVCPEVVRVADQLLRHEKYLAIQELVDSLKRVFRKS